MTDLLFRSNNYNHSRHARRIKSRQKKSQKLDSKQENQHKQKRVRFLAKSAVNSKKSCREIQRKQWSKYNRKSKPRTALTCTSRSSVSQYDPIYGVEYEEWEAYDSPCSADDASSGSSHHSRSFGASPVVLFESDHLRIKQSRSTPKKGEYSHPIILVNNIRRAVSKQYESFECNFFPFDMTTFDGQCWFWWSCMDKLGLIEELFWTRYLQRIDADSSSKLSYYQRFVRGIVKYMLHTDHLLYILNEIDAMVDAQFDEDFNNADYVVMNRRILLTVLDTHNSEDIGIDLCTIITQYVMSEHDVLAHYQQDEDILHELTEEDVGKIHTLKYRIDRHHVIDQQYQDGQSYEDKLIAKIYDGKDMTKQYQQAHKAWQDGKPFFHEGEYSETWDNVLKITWSQFSAYCERCSANSQNIRYSMLYVILWDYVQSANVIKDVRCTISPVRQHHFELWQRAWTETKNDPLLQNILTALAASLPIIPHNKASEFEHDQKRDVLDIFKHSLQQQWNSTLSSQAELQEFCVMMSHNTVFMNTFHYNDFLEYEDQHHQHKEFWLNIWKSIPATVNAETLAPLYRLMMWHCKRYKKQCSKHTEYGHYGGRWGCHSMVKFDLLDFVYTRIVPLIMHRMELVDSSTEEIVLRNIRILRYRLANRVDSYEELLRCVASVDKYVYGIDRSLEVVNGAANLEQYGTDKYHRKYVSKKRDAMRKALKTRFRKWNGKANEKRIEYKMQKYQPYYLIEY